MSKYFILLLLLSTLSLSACGGGDGGNPSPNSGTNPPTVPNVAGTYDCTGGCNSLNCSFSSVLEVTQTGNNFIAHDPDPRNSSSDLTGTVNNDGGISATMDNGTCTGQFVQGRVVAQCTVDSKNCQDVTYTRRN